jgi:hypothetical protein
VNCCRDVKTTLGAPAVVSVTLLTVGPVFSFLDEGSIVQYNYLMKRGSLRKYIFAHSLQNGTECW